MYEFLSLDVVDGLATVTLSRPPVNALSRGMQEELRAVAQEVSGRTDVDAVVFTGSDRVFAAGADIKEMRQMPYAQMLTEARELQSAFTAVAEIPQPTVAAITGAALGGGMELALCCDRRIAAERATLGQPEILLGIIPGAGGTQRLARLVGPAVAKELCLTGRTLTAAEALELRAVDEVVPDGQATARATEWARQFVGGPRMALRAVKEAVDRGIEVDLATGLSIERALFAALFATEDREVGMQSFIDSGPGKADFLGR
ncbi:MULTISPECIES: enoyl-CoA hydratase/isomerase family protein [unclassified Dietzia]|uniref:enoyl-CoA hydratase/isomerase family protein n=2 Tax=Dietzia TaxID=37914 RepID=UPI000D2067CE|nr:MULTISPECIES: enoyl-CoA hydratase-related protein [unclassified Dietzia]AVZ40323.1 enoyl-CoA hydratase [Dietzia sp. JS16-p6b]QGW25802.1 short chain enoyl-CoA hydratase [Dietzia sp. DQ12-45-1b]